MSVFAGLIGSMFHVKRGRPPHAQRPRPERQRRSPRVRRNALIGRAVHFRQMESARVRAPKISGHPGDGGQCSDLCGRSDQPPLGRTGPGGSCPPPVSPFSQPSHQHSGWIDGPRGPPAPRSARGALPHLRVAERCMTVESHAYREPTTRAFSTTVGSCRTGACTGIRAGLRARPMPPWLRSMPGRSSSDGSPGNCDFLLPPN